MVNTNKTGVQFIKTDSGEIVVKNQKKYNKLLDNLAPGIYDLILRKKDQRLTRMKRYYFSMESHLAEHLGMEKKDLHIVLKPLFTKFDDHGERIYASVAEIQECEEMMQRIYAFQEYSAREHKYTHEPYTDEEIDKPLEDMK